MEKILISACLVGDKCKYNGQSNYTPLIKDLLEKYELVPLCPELLGGLTVPRKPCERRGIKVVNEAGKDVTKAFVEGAEKVYNVCLYLGVTTAILKDCSPSCGVYKIYDGTFSHKEINGQGVTAELLTKKGIKVLSENDIPSLL